MRRLLRQMQQINNHMVLKVTSIKQLKKEMQPNRIPQIPNQSSPHLDMVLSKSSVALVTNQPTSRSVAKGKTSYHRAKRKIFKMYKVQIRTIDLAYRIICILMHRLGVNKIVLKPKAVSKCLQWDKHSTASTDSRLFSSL